MKTRNLTLAVLSTLLMLFVAAESHAQACGFATFTNLSGCGTNVSVLTTAGNVYTAFVANGGTVTIPFGALTECVVSITINCAVINQPQPAICMPLVPACTVCPRWLCLNGANSWLIL